MDEEKVIAQSQEEEKSHILVEPEYFKNFHCLANHCHYDCCHGWKITIPKGDYSRIRSCKKSKEIEKLVNEGIVRNKKEVNNTFYAQMNLKENQDCVFLDENRLCKLQMECGYKVLPEVCKTFPRRVFIYDKLVERSCSTGCEEVVNLLWKLPKGIQFEEKSFKGFIFGQRTGEELKETLTYKHFRRIQKLTIQILQNKEYSMGGRIILLGMALKELAAIEKNEEAGDDAVEAWLKKYRAFTTGNQYEEMLAKLPQNTELFMMNVISTAEGISQSIESEYRQAMKKILETLQVKRNEGSVTMNRAVYRAAKEELNKFMKANEYLLENIMVNQWFYFGGPLDTDGIWHNYIRFCVLYSQLLILLTGQMLIDQTDDEIVHIITVWSRLFLHNKTRIELLIKDLVHNQSDSLAHMAILVNG